MRRTFYMGFSVIIGIIVVFMLLINIDLFAVLIFLGILAVIAIYDVVQKEHSILRNFPILGHIRFILEFMRPEIQQYFVADDESEKPFNREIRSMIYQRAKNVRDTVPFGTQRDIYQEGYEWMLHSLMPTDPKEINERVVVGNEQCKQPYNASRLNISAMSFGALSANAILALNKGAKIGNFAHNTGEGGLSDHHLQGGGDIIWQIGTGYFGCRNKEGGFDANKFTENATKTQVKMIEIKLSQGAKPSHGGILPAAKLTPEIATIRGVPMGQDVVSPAAHTAFSTPKGLLEFVQKLRELSGGKPVGFKLCLGRRSQFLGICKAMVKTKIYPDFITVDGAEGGTGAAPLEYSNRVGTPLEVALVFVHNALVGSGVREHIKVIASGKVATGFDMINKLALGADMCNSARAMMMSVGCLQSRQCNANTCPTGVATQDKKLMRGLDVETKKQRAANYHNATVHSMVELLCALGLKSPDELDPSMIRKRISSDSVKNISDIHEFIAPDSLLKKNVPEGFKLHWERANADTF